MFHLVNPRQYKKSDKAGSEFVSVNVRIDRFHSRFEIGPNNGPCPCASDTGKCVQGQFARARMVEDGMRIGATQFNSGGAEYFRWCLVRPVNPTGR